MAKIERLLINGTETHNGWTKLGNDKRVIRIGNKMNCNGDGLICDHTIKDSIISILQKYDIDQSNCEVNNIHTEYEFSIELILSEYQYNYFKLAVLIESYYSFEGLEKNNLSLLNLLKEQKSYVISQVDKFIESNIKYIILGNLSQKNDIHYLVRFKSKFYIITENKESMSINFIARKVVFIFDSVIELKDFLAKDFQTVSLNIAS